MENINEKIEESIKKLENKENTFYFLTQDTKGNAKGSVRFIYQIALSLSKVGFNVCILHEEENYTKIGKWTSSEFDELKHMCIKNSDLKVSPEDVIIIPEIFGYVLEQLTNLPCEKVILCQSYDYIFETLKPGVTWAELGFMKVITTSELQKKYVSSVMKSNAYTVIEPIITENFSKKPYPSKPIISILTRDQRDTMKIIKTFYIKYPQFRWITFRDMRGLNEEQFSEYLKDSFVSVWIDDISAFGTFPLESMSCGTPVIGKVPNMKPEWLNEDNGIWTYETNNIVDIISEYTQNWLEDNINEDLYEKGYETSNKFKDYESFDSKVNEVFSAIQESRIKMFKDKFETVKLQ
jgi:glycosyltransferase involved in cell wall biosynthesis